MTPKGSEKLVPKLSNNSIKNFEYFWSNFQTDFWNKVKRGAVFGDDMWFGAESLYNGEMFWCVLYKNHNMRHFLCVLLMN